MEDKKINEQESLEIITKMIQQTKQDSAIGSGDMFLMWGYLCTICSLGVFAMAFIQKNGAWGWLYIAIPVLGFIIAGIMARRMAKKHNIPATYATKSINGIWACLSGVFAAYAVICLLHMDNASCWTGMFFLGLLLPGIGTYSTGVILKENILQICGMFGIITGLYFLNELCTYGAGINIKWPIVMAISMVITLVIPGHYLNYKSKKNKA